MQKITVFLFLSIYLFSNSPMGELLKIPALVQHYCEHKSENKEMSVFVFLYLHYANGAVHDADDEQDMKLPFKKIIKNTFSVFYLESPNKFISLQQKYEYEAVFPRLLPYYNFRYSFTYFYNIWQPPRFNGYVIF